MDTSKTALISGAGGGIGSAVAAQLLGSGWHVLAGLRDLSAAYLHPLATHPRWHPLPLDLQQPAEVLQKQVAQTLSKLPFSQSLDALVLCAGLDVAGAFEELPMATWKQIMAVNFLGPVALTQAVLPAMRAHRKGAIIAISSLSGLVGLPGNSAYAASKFALEGAFEALRLEVVPWHIAVTLLEPGAMQTEMSARFRRPTDGVPLDCYAPLIDHTLRQRQAPGRGAAEDLSTLALTVQQLIENGAAQLRVPVGAQAERVVARLGALDAIGREQFCVEAAGAAFWLESGD